MSGAFPAGRGEPRGGACRAITNPPPRAVARDGAPSVLILRRGGREADAANVLGKAGKGQPSASVMRVAERVKDKPALPVLRILDPLADSRRQGGRGIEAGAGGAGPRW